MAVDTNMGMDPRLAKDEEQRQQHDRDQRLTSPFRHKSIRELQHDRGDPYRGKGGGYNAQSIAIIERERLNEGLGLSNGPALGGPAGGDLDGFFPDPELNSITAGGTSGVSKVRAPIVTVDAKGRVTSQSDYILPLVNLFDHFTDAGNTGTGETDLYSDTLSAGILNANGAKIDARYAGTALTHATATRQFKVYFGGTAIFDSGALTLTSTTAWDVTVLVIRVSATTVRCVVSMEIPGLAAPTYVAYTEVTGLTLANTQILKITGQAAGVGAATNDIVAKLGSVACRQAA